MIVCGVLMSLFFFFFLIFYFDMFAQEGEGDSN
jgi:hypothetical protein